MTENFDSPESASEQPGEETPQAECPRTEPNSTASGSVAQDAGWQGQTPAQPPHPFPLGPPPSHPYGQPTHQPPPFGASAGTYGAQPGSFGSNPSYWGAHSPSSATSPTGSGHWGPPPSWPPAGTSWSGTPSPDSRQPQKGKKWARPLVATILVAAVALAGLVGALVGHSIWQSTSNNPGLSSQSAFGNNPSSGNSNNSNSSGNNSSNNSNDPSGSGSSDSSASAIAAKVDPGLVDINTTLGYESLEGAGTGMVLTSNGLILTNNHVVEGATSISVTDIGNGRSYSASVVGYDRSKDVALVQLTDASGLTTVSIATSGVSVGEEVVAIGNAGGAGGTPSYAAGTITATGQSITASDEANGATEQLTGLIETNADIVAGDSGGPLVNSDGQVLGMDTAAAQGFSIQSSSSQGYSIPISEADQLASSIRSGDSSTSIHIGATAFLGVEVESSESSGTQGALIAELLQSGPASAAGLEEGDTIVSLGGTSVSSPEGLTDVILAKKPGDTVQVQYFDSSGTEHTTSVTLGSGPPQ